MSLGQLHLLSQGDVKGPESCLSEALLTADLCVFSHLSQCSVCVSAVKDACLRASWCIWIWACKWGTLKDLSLLLCCVNEQSVLLIFSQAYPGLSSALPVVTGKLWQLKSADLLAVRSAYTEDISLCFLPTATGTLTDADPGTETTPQTTVTSGIIHCLGFKHLSNWEGFIYALCSNWRKS